MPGTAGPIRLIQQLCKTFKDDEYLPAHPGAINYLLRDINSPDSCNGISDKKEKRHHHLKD